MNGQIISVIILVGMQLIALGIYLTKDGEPKEGKYSFFGCLISFVIVLTLYYFAGMFNNFF